jgi:alpha-glucosidase
MNENPGGRRWWQGATLYQLYIRSWRDTDGDGYGDLGGVIAGLDYLSWLGVDGIWLSPTMPSPDQDWGYDVSDYRGVHPELGTLEDMDRLVAEAGARGMRVLLDLVPNHTSSAHPWFVDAASGRGSEHRDYYMWADPAPGGGPPSNWVDAVGKSAWAWHEPTGQYYLHLFLDSQPDLNWREPAVHREFEQILRFWFDRGIAGFRIDVAQGLYKDAELRDNPPAPDANRLTGRSGQAQVYSANRPESHGVFRDWRKIAEKYQPSRLLLGETWVGDFPTLAGYYGHDDELQLAFNFPFVFSAFTAPELPGVVDATLTALPAGACPVWTASNHDAGRFPTRWCGGDERKARLALLLLAMLPGALVLYYGDEIGMTDAVIPPELRRDKMSAESDGWDGSRDRARTPMPWDGSPAAGFTADGVTPWLPVGDAARRNVADQRRDPGSLLALCRRLLALRHAELGGDAGRVPAYEALPAAAGQWVYRIGGLIVAANLSDEPATVTGPFGAVLISSSGAEQAAADAAGPAAGLVLGPWQGLVARRHPAGPATA